MPHADFVHLRVHSAYSLSEGAIRTGELAELCRRHAMPAVAVADSENLFGALEFSAAAASVGVQPIIGCQLAMARSDPNTQNGSKPAPDQLVVLVQNEVGYRNLLHLVSRAYLAGEPGDMAELDLAAFEGHSDGLIALTGGVQGAVGRFLKEQRDEWAEGMLLTLARLFPGRLYVELQRHGLAEEDAIEGRLVDLAPKPRCTRRTTPCCASPRALTWRRPIAGALRPSTASSRQRRCVAFSTTCPRRSTIPW
jgi:DNA polymerase-3 subunit alpha